MTDHTMPAMIYLIDEGDDGWHWCADPNPSGAYPAPNAVAYVRKDATSAGEQVGLTDAELEAGRHQVFSTSNPFCPCDSKTFRKAARWAIAAHEAKKGGA